MCDSASPWTVAFQAPLSVEFFRQEYWSGLPYPPPGDLFNARIERRSPELQADSLLSAAPGKSLWVTTNYKPSVTIAFAEFKEGLIWNRDS